MKDVLQRAHQAAEGPEAAKLWGDFLQKMRDILSKILADAEEKYNAGDRRQLFTAIQMSALLSVPAPKWAEDALARAGLGGPLETWDDVFGRPAGPPDSAGKRKRPETAFRHSMLSFPIYATVETMHSQGRNIEPDLFDEVGEKFGISGRTASGIYYDAIETARPIIDALKEGVINVLRDRFPNNIAEEVASLAMNLMFNVAQRLPPEELFGVANKIREGVLGGNLIKGGAALDAMEPEIARAYAYLSEFSKKLTKTS
jgi:hypothetical protein